MAIVHKCDRCGKYCDRTPNEIDTTIYHALDGPSGNNYDLCDDCMDDFDEFMRGAKPKNLLDRILGKRRKPEPEYSVAYLCDGRQCEKCTYPICSRTTDIRHAKNFKCLHDNKWIEKGRED